MANEEKELVERAKAALALAEKMGLIGAHPTNIHRIATDLVAAVERLSAIERERDALREALTTAKARIVVRGSSNHGDTVEVYFPPYNEEAARAFATALRALNQTRTDASETTK